MCVSTYFFKYYDGFFNFSFEKHANGRLTCKPSLCVLLQVDTCLLTSVEECLYCTAFIIIDTESVKWMLNRSNTTSNVKAFSGAGRTLTGNSQHNIATGFEEKLQNLDEV